MWSLPWSVNLLRSLRVLHAPIGCVVVDPVGDQACWPIPEPGSGIELIGVAAGYNRALPDLVFFAFDFDRDVMRLCRIGDDGIAHGSEPGGCDRADGGGIDRAHVGKGDRVHMDP